MKEDLKVMGYYKNTTREQIVQIKDFKKDKRISYIIHAGKIASARSLWKFRKYTGINPHHKHIHISFKPNQNGKKFDIPLLKGN